MAIISKPNVINKGTSVTFSLYKTNLVNNFVVSSSEHFSDFSNWMRVNLNYGSTEGNQVKIVTFDYSNDFSEGVFTSSNKVRDSFAIQSITIIDFDGEMLTVNRDQINTLEFDIEFASESESVLLLDDGSIFFLDSNEPLAL